MYLNIISNGPTTKIQAKVDFRSIFSIYEKDNNLILSTNLYSHNTLEVFRSQVLNEFNENIQIELDNFVQESNEEKEPIINFPFSLEIISQTILEEERTMMNDVLNTKLNQSLTFNKARLNLHSFIESSFQAIKCKLKMIQNSNKKFEMARTFHNFIYFLNEVNKDLNLTQAKPFGDLINNK